MDKLKAGQRRIGVVDAGMRASLIKDGYLPPLGYTELPKGERQHGPDYSNEEILKHFKVPHPLTREAVLQMEVEKLQELLNEKDEQIDKLSRPMIVRLDLWTIGIVVLVFGAHHFGYM